MNAGENMVFMGGGIRAGGNASLSAGGDLLLLAYDTGKQVRVIPRDKDDNPNNDKGPTWAYENSTYNQTGVDSNVGGSFSDSAGGNLSAVGSIDIVGAQIDSQGFAASAGGNYSERAAYDIHERVSTSSTKMSGPGTYLLDFTNNMNWLATGGQAGGRTETYRGTNDVDSTRTAIVTNINAGSGEVKHNVAGETFIEGSIVKGGLISPERLGPRVTLAAAMDTRHVEHSVSTSTIRWQSTDSTGYIQQTLHMPEIHGTIPAGMSAYQGAGGVSVQLPAGSNVRSAIEQLSKEPGKEYLKELGNRSDIDWQRVDVLNKSLDFSKSGLTQEATIAVIIVVSILTYGAASSAGGAAATSAGMTTTATGAGATTVAATGAGVAGTGVAAGTVLTTTGAAVASAVTAGLTSLASTAAVSLINNKGDIGAVLKELGSKENAQGLLLTMATAGLTQGVLDKAGLSGVSGASPIEYVLAKQAVQGLTSAVLESAVLGTNLEDAIKNNLKSALINTVAAKGAFTIGEGGKTGDLNAASKVIAHALLGCAVGAANAGNGSGCAPGAAGGAIGEIVAGLYADASGYDDLKSRANAPGADPALKQQLAVVTNTMTELAKLSGAGAALLIGGDASTAQIAMGTAQNAAQNNRQLHADEKERIKQLAAGDPQKEARLTAAACAMARCYAEYPEGSATYNALKTLADAGGSDALAAERAQLKGQTGLFTYTTDGLLSDQNKDAIKQLNNTYQVTTRLAGAAQGVLGAVGVGASVATAPVSCATGIGCVANTAVATISADQAITGTKQAWSGTSENTYLNQTLQGLGLSHEAATYAEFAFGLGAAATASKVATNAVATTLTGETAASKLPAGANKGGAVEPVVTAKGTVNRVVFEDFNQTAKIGATNEPTLIADRVAAKTAAQGKSFPNGTVADSHAEIGVIQQAYEAGKTKGSVMSMTVSGKDVCGYCKGDIAAAAEAAELKSLTVQAIDSVTGLPKTYYWQPGMKSIKEKQ